MLPCVIHRDPPHRLGSYLKENGSTTPIPFSLLDQLQIGLMHQGGRLQGAVLPVSDLVQDNRNVRESSTRFLRLGFAISTAILIEGARFGRPPRTTITTAAT
jgi:hypothetical protein